MSAMQRKLSAERFVRFAANYPWIAADCVSAKFHCIIQYNQIGYVIVGPSSEYVTARFRP